MKEIVIYGAGSFGKVIVEILKDLNDTLYPEWKLVGFLDDDLSRKGTDFYGFPVLGDSEILKGKKRIAVVLAISNYMDKSAIYKNILNINKDVIFPNLIHPSAWVAESVEMGEGTIVYPGAGIDPEVKIGRFCTINKNVTIGDASQLKDFVNLSAGVNVGSWNFIGACSSWGKGSNSTRAIKVNEKSIIGAGTVLLKDVPAEATVIGNPGKILQLEEML